MKKQWNDKCAVFGVWNHQDASLLTYFGLYAQQHRGQEGAGIVSASHSSESNLQPDCFRHQKGLGLVSDVFNEHSLKDLPGNIAIGHTRYSTRGKSQDQKNIQPLISDFNNKPFALAHNGQFVNFQKLKSQLTQNGYVFDGTGDTECLVHLIRSYSGNSFVDAFKKSLQHLEGAYSLVLLTSECLIAARDPRGFRPLVIGEKKDTDSEETSWVVASETCALDLLEASYVREVQCGEILVVSKNKIESHFIKKTQKRKACVFEHIYFARPDSYVFGEHVYDIRKQLGKALAKQAPVDADLVIPVPDSGAVAALGYSEESQIPYEMGIIRNHYVGRTFIQPAPLVRDFRVKIKLNPQRHLIKNKRIIVVDDSLVRGTTSRSIVKLLRGLGAKEIHFRISSPPVTHPCHYGIDTPQKSELISSYKNVVEIKDFLQVDSLEFLSLNQLRNVVNGEKTGYCEACFTGKYPTLIEEEHS